MPFYNQKLLAPRLRRKPALYGRKVTSRKQSFPHLVFFRLLSIAILILDLVFSSFPSGDVIEKWIGTAQCYFSVLLILGCVQSRDWLWQAERKGEKKGVAELCKKNLLFLRFFSIFQVSRKLCLCIHGSKNQDYVGYRRKFLLHGDFGWSSVWCRLH